MFLSSVRHAWHRKMPGKCKLIKRRTFLDCESQAILSAVLILVMLHENEPRVYAALSSNAFLILGCDLDTVNSFALSASSGARASSVSCLASWARKRERDGMEVDMRMQGEACLCHHLW